MNNANEMLEALELAAFNDFLDIEIENYSNEELRAAEYALYEREGIILHSQIKNLKDYQQYLIEAIKSEVNTRIETASKEAREEELQRRINR